jgi:ElaB/YqjD/DUF883 family membrane-anchored ribosome-binding protein
MRGRLFSLVQVLLRAQPHRRRQPRRPSFVLGGADRRGIHDNTGKDKIMHMKSDIAETDANGHGAGSAATAAPASSSGEFHNFIADIEDLITSMTPLTGEDLARAKARLSERVSTAKQSIAEVSEEVAHRARKTARDTNHYVHEHPWQAVGIGAALGLLIGVLVARRN